MTGYEDMPKVVAYAAEDIKHHLWSLYWICRLLKAKKAVELGVRAGDSTRAILAAMKDTGGRLISFDIRGDARDVRGLTQGMGIPWIEGIWGCRQEDSVKAGHDWPSNCFIGSNSFVDLVFVDTLHTYEHTLKEILAWERHVLLGGAMVFHDTGNLDPHQNGVRPAIDTFLEKNSPRWSFEDHPHVADADVGMGILWRVGK